MKNIMIFYHNDEDGFGAAWAAWKKFGSKADYKIAEYGMPPPKFLKNKEIFFVDFYYDSMQVMKKIIKDNKKVVVIDHHISHKETVKAAHEYSFSLKNSAAVLAWKYFHPQKPMPKILLCIEDMDLWKFKIKFTREIIASLATYDFRFKVWNKIARDLENPKGTEKYIADGKAIIKYQDKIIKKIADMGIRAALDGKRAIAVNSPILESEVGNYIWKNKGVMGLIWSLQNKKLEVHLRSGDKIDVSKIAKKFGGGGHKAVSGFDLLNFDSKIKFPWKRTK